MRTIIDMAADRGAYICQSQSLNLFISQPSASKLTSMHFYAWKKGLKTGMYYLRTQAAAQAIKFSVQSQAVKEIDPVVETVSADVEMNGESCSMEDGCLSCGS